MTSVRRGVLVAFEGLDQSGKQTQAEELRESLAARGLGVHLLSFPDYQTPIGQELRHALSGEREFGPDVMQLLYVANRYEWKPRMLEILESGTVLICDRYMASSVAYGEAHGLDPEWLRAMQRFLPIPDLTILLDIPPDASARRKTTGRDRYERDLVLLGRVRDSYLRQAGDGWICVDGDRGRADVAADILTAVTARIGSMLVRR